jgi:hypothetical protein
MEKGYPTETAIRDYLLGRLDDETDNISAQIDERALTDTDFSEHIAVIEDEIIEEYLEGTLSASDRESCEHHFLRPPERQRRLRNARLLNLHLAASSRPAVDAKRTTEIEDVSRRVVPYQRFLRNRAYLEIAAGLLLIASLAYSVRQHRRLKDDLSAQRQRLAQEREENAQSNRRLRSAAEPAKDTTAELNLLEPRTLRGNSQLPRLNIGSAKGSIHTEVALPPGAAGTFALQIVCAEKPVWSHGPIASQPIRGGSILIFDFPGKVLSSGNCSLSLQHVSNEIISYSFLVSQ